jgi:hypothetical protein
MDDAELLKRVNDHINHCLALTVRLTCLSKRDLSPAGVASGFLTSLDGATYLISAGHALDEGNWVIETDMVVESEGRTACIPVNGPWIIKSFTLGSSGLKDVDVSWAKIDLDRFQNEVRAAKGLSGKPFEMLTYQGPFGETPDRGTPYSYASRSRVVVYEALGKRHLERQSSFELEMSFTGRTTDEGLCVFSIPEHKGHAYYEGASGSPILDPTGQIFAILVGGCETRNELYGYPLRSIPYLIRVGEESSKH